MNELETALNKIATDLPAYMKESASAFTGIAESVKDNRSVLDKFVAEFKEAIPKVKVEAEVDGKPVEGELGKLTDPAGAGVLSGITKTEVFGIPLGQIAIGTFGGVFVSEILDGFLAKQSTMVKGAVKLGIAGVTATWGKRWLGKDVSYAIAFVLGVFGLSQILPIDKWAAGIAGKVGGMLPGTIKVTGMPGNVVVQAQQVANDYYSRLGGRR